MSPIPPSPDPLLLPSPPRPSSVPPPSLLRCSSVAPPLLLRSTSQHQSEEGRRKDGGATEEGRWQQLGTGVMAAFCQARNSWHGGIIAGCSCCRQAHPCGRKREIPEEDSPVGASGRSFAGSGRTRSRPRQGRARRLSPPSVGSPVLNPLRNELLRWSEVP